MRADNYNLEVRVHDQQDELLVEVYRSVGHLMVVGHVKHLATELVADAAADPQINVTMAVHDVGACAIDVGGREVHMRRLTDRLIAVTDGILRTHKCIPFMK